MSFLRDLIGKDSEHEVKELMEKKEAKYTGKITKVVNDPEAEKSGWGFLSTKEIPFERVFFHWTGLAQDTLKFVQLRKGMKVEFVAHEQEGRGWQAFKIKVIE